MNPRFQFQLIRYLNRYPLRSHQGFVLPMAMMIGLVVIVVGMTVIIRAQGDKTKVVSQSLTNQAAAIAEAGATQYINFLNNNRGLIPYPSCVTQDSTGACSDTNAVKSWYGAALTTTGSSTSIPNINPSSSTGTPSPSPSPSCSSSSSSTDLPANYQQASTTSIATWANSTTSGGWKDLPNGAGQYRLVGYRTYTNSVATTEMNPSSDQPTSVAAAKLTVEGRANANAVGNAIARMEFIIPVAATTGTGASPSPSPSSSFPGLWARDFSGFGGASAVYADVWDSSGCVSGASNATSVPFDKLPSTPLTLWRETGKKNPKETVPGDKANNGNKDLYMQSGSNGTRTVVNQAFPPLPNNTVPSSNVNTCPLTSSGQLPRNNDVDSTGKTYKTNGSGTAPADATYLYNCNSSEVETPGSNLILGRTGQETLKFYISGALKVNSDGNLVPYTSQAWTSGLSGPYQPFTRSIFYVGTYVQFNGKGNVGDMRDPTAMQFYVYGSDAGTINTSGYQHTLEMKGNSSFYGFLFAPNGNLSGVGTSDLGGALWIKSIEKSTGNTKIWQGIFDTTRLEITLPTSSSYTTYNLGGTPSQWRRVPVQ